MKGKRGGRKLGSVGGNNGEKGREDGKKYRNIYKSDTILKRKGKSEEGGREGRRK